MKTTIYVPDITCDSCVRVISKVLDGREGVSGFIVKGETVEIEHEPTLIPAESLVHLIKGKGFRAGLDPFVRKTFGERIREFVSRSDKYSVEQRMIKYSALSFISISVIVTYLFSWLDPSAGLRYSWWLLYLIISVVGIGGAIWHFKSYKTEVTSMVGMMVGMTFGMQSGLMIGTILGATNGMFIGSLAGMLLGVGVGWYNGKCCGIMGVMEGMMAGVMGGTMGAMLGVMLMVDHILWFMPAFMAVNILILWGLSYMLFEEMVEHKTTVRAQPIEFSTLVGYCLLAVLLIAGLMIYGPKTGIATTLWQEDLTPVEGRPADPPVISPPATNTDATGKNPSVQEVTLGFAGSTYSPEVINLKKDIPVRLIGDMTTLKGCYTSIVIPQLGLSKYMRAGDNVLEFTPTQTGHFRLTCSMGMANAVINVE